MEELIEKFRRKLGYVRTDFIRSLVDEINWETRLIGIKGARGVGKTTLLLQYIKQKGALHVDVSLYVSLDSICEKRRPIFVFG
jgi:predicted AAA+ superfamily ATPase